MTPLKKPGMYSYAVEVYIKQFLLHQWHPSCYSCYHNLMTRYVELTKYWLAQKPDIIYPKWSDMSTCRLFFSTLALCNLIPVQNTKILTPDDHASVLFFIIPNPIILSSFLTSQQGAGIGHSFRAPEFTSNFIWVCVAQFSVLFLVFCVSLFVYCHFIFCIICPLIYGF